LLYIFVAELWGYLNHFYIIPPFLAAEFEFSRITQNNVQGNSRSPVVVPIESSYGLPINELY